MAWGLTLVALALVILTIKCERVRSPRQLGDVRVGGSMQEDGPTTHGHRPPDGLRYWSSWAGDESRHGTLTLGPLRLPRRLGLFVSGYPQVRSNSVVVENLETGAAQIQHIDNIGEGWRPVRMDYPDAWHGQRAIIRVVDESEGWGAWIATTEPFSWPWWTDWAHGFTLRLAAFGLTLLATALLIGGASRMLVATGALSLNSVFLLPTAAGCVASAGFLLFLVGVISPSTVKGIAWLMVLAASWAALGPLPRGVWRILRRDAPTPRSAASFRTHESVWNHDWFAASAVTVLSAVLVFSMLHLFASSGPLSELARSRFNSGPLPTDNSISQSFAERLWTGHPARSASSPGSSSDRPPLQIGWVLAVTPLSLSLGFSYDTAAQCAGIWFQCLAIPAVWAMLRSVGASPSTSTAIILAIVPSGFFFIHLTFVWPKMAAGAFALLAFLLWFGDGRRHAHVRRSDLMAGIFAGLAWLAHGGIGFALLALAPAVASNCLRGHWRRWTASAAGFLILALPWTAYQKFYDPPGNRLLKWHLAGVLPPDDSSTMNALVSAYRTQSLESFLNARRENCRAVADGEWRALASFAFGDGVSRRTREFFHLLFALGWWNLGWISLPLAVVLKRIRVSEASALGRLLGWAIGTTLLWIILIYIGGEAVIHQGPYSILLVLFPAMALAVLRLHRGLFAAVMVFQAVTFLNVWMTPPCAALGRTWEPGPVATAACVLLAESACIFAISKQQNGQSVVASDDPTAAGS